MGGLFENALGGGSSLAISLVFLLLVVGAMFFALRWLWVTFSTGVFVGGQRKYKKRLDVIDAAPIDNRRRLVLLRRDDVEHLVLIGGMNDVLIESSIPAKAEEADQPQSAPKQKEKLAKKQADAEPELVSTAKEEPALPKEPAPAKPAPKVPAAPAIATNKTEPVMSADPQPQPRATLDDLDLEFELSADDLEVPDYPAPPVKASSAAPTQPNTDAQPIEDEMDRLLKQLSGEKR